MVCATLRTSWRTDSSAPLLVGTPALRKYLETATSVASCDHSAGTSASSILKTTSPSAPEILAGRRVHSTPSSTCCAVASGGVVRRRTERPLARLAQLPHRASLGPQMLIGSGPLLQTLGVDMKTLTEFSGTMIRMAARAEAEARKTIPKELLRVAPAPTPAEGVTAKPNENAS